jgi:LPXTG-motif cell wall-anchored protein
MKRIISTICLVIMIIGLSSVGYCNEGYSVKYVNYTPDTNIALLTYLKWSITVNVDNKNIPLSTSVEVDNLNCLITIEGKNNKNNLIYKGTLSENLNLGDNNQSIVVNKVNTDPNIWSPGNNVLNWKVYTKVLSIIPTETPTKTPTETPIIVSETPTKTSSDIEVTKTPVIEKLNIQGKDELPKTGDEIPLIIYFVGVSLIIIGTVIFIKKCPKI